MTAKTTSKRKVCTKKIISAILLTLTLLSALGAIAITGAVTAAKLTGKTPTIFGLGFMLVQTGSMTPGINPGDLVVALKTDAAKIEQGDDIVFVTRDPSLKGITIVHRVLKITPSGEFVTGGIKEGLGEDKYTVKEPIGKVIAVSAFWGKILTFAVDNRNWMFVILLTAAIFIGVGEVTEIVKIVREPSNDNE